MKCIVNDVSLCEMGASLFIRIAEYFSLSLEAIIHLPLIKFIDN